MDLEECEDELDLGPSDLMHFTSNKFSESVLGPTSFSNKFSSSSSEPLLPSFTSRVNKHVSSQFPNVTNYGGFSETVLEPASNLSFEQVLEPSIVPMRLSELGSSSTVMFGSKDDESSLRPGPGPPISFSKATKQMLNQPSTSSETSKSTDPVLGPPVSDHLGYLSQFPASNSLFDLHDPLFLPSGPVTSFSQQVQNLSSSRSFLPNFSLPSDSSVQVGSSRVDQKSQHNNQLLQLLQESENNEKEEIEVESEQPQLGTTKRLKDMGFSSCAACRKAHKRCERPEEAPNTCRACLRKNVACILASEPRVRKKVEPRVIPEMVITPSPAELVISPAHALPTLTMGNAISNENSERGNKYDRRILRSKTILDQLKHAETHTSPLFLAIVARISSGRNSKKLTLLPMDYISQFHAQEKSRYTEFSNKSFAFHLNGIKYVSTPPLSPLMFKDRDAHFLVSERPSALSFGYLVRDAVARLPGGVGTLADILFLLLQSQFLCKNIPESELKNALSATLIRLQTEPDMSIHFVREFTFWIYCHRNRNAEVDLFSSSPILIPFSTLTCDFSNDPLPIDTDLTEEEEEEEEEESSICNRKMYKWIALRNEFAWRWHWLECQLSELEYLQEDSSFKLINVKSNEVEDRITFLQHPIMQFGRRGMPTKKIRLEELYEQFQTDSKPLISEPKKSIRDRRSRKEEIQRNEAFSFVQSLSQFLLQNENASVSEICSHFTHDISSILERTCPFVRPHDFVLLFLQFLLYPQTSSDFKRHFVTLNAVGQPLQPLVSFDSHSQKWCWIENSDQVTEDTLVYVEIMFFFGISRVDSHVFK